MRSSVAARFCKLASCPSAETLLLHERDALALEKQWSVRVHLSVCDFCGAEFQLLSKHAQAASCDAVAGPAAIAAHMLRLAEDLLAAPEQATAKLIGAFYGKEPLEITDAQN